MEATLTNEPRLRFWTRKELPVDVEAISILKALPVVNEVAEIEAIEPIVLDDLNSNEPEAALPVSVSTMSKTDVGVVFRIPTRLLFTSKLVVGLEELATP